MEHVDICLARRINFVGELALLKLEGNLDGTLLGLNFLVTLYEGHIVEHRIGGVVLIIRGPVERIHVGIEAIGTLADTLYDELSIIGQSIGLHQCSRHLNSIVLIDILGLGRGFGLIFLGLILVSGLVLLGLFLLGLLGRLLLGGLGLLGRLLLGGLLLVLDMLSGLRLLGGLRVFLPLISRLVFLLTLGISALCGFWRRFRLGLWCGLRFRLRDCFRKDGDGRSLFENVLTNNIVTVLARANLILVAVDRVGHASNLESFDRTNAKQHVGIERYDNLWRRRIMICSVVRKNRVLQAESKLGLRRLRLRLGFLCWRCFCRLRSLRLLRCRLWISRLLRLLSLRSRAITFPLGRDLLGHFLCSL